MQKIKIISVVGARPNFMKIAPIAKELKKYKSITHRLVHTGQHYDEKMSKVFFDDLDIPKPHINLEVKKSSHAEQTAEIIRLFEGVCLKEKPDCVLVVGDVNSTIACALTAVKLGIKVAHIEAGLRSFDRSMPEEINRLLTDQISDYLFVTEKSGVSNLKREGISNKKIFFVGNTMIDTLFCQKQKAIRSNISSALYLKQNEYFLLTLHRPANVDDPKMLNTMISAVLKGAGESPVIFPVHPRTQKMLSKAHESHTKLRIIDPLGYVDFVHLMMHARAVVTDSGGIQEETSVLGVPCLTLRNNTERPITITRGTNILVGSNPHNCVRAMRRVVNNKKTIKKIPRWDGKAAVRIVKILKSKLSKR
jgi:UDP-N-acetylglucosamine 2-epimerase (non-hydrolysing)